MNKIIDVLRIASLTFIFFFSPIGSQSAFASARSDQAFAAGKKEETSGNFLKEAQNYRKAQAYPESAQLAILPLARVLIELNELDEAFALTNQYISTVNSFDIEVHYLQIDIYLKKKQFAEAMSSVQALEELRPGLIKTFEKRGLVHFYLGKADKAVEDLNQVLKNNSENQTARFFRAQSY